MLARLQQLIFATTLLGSALWAILFARAGHPIWAALGPPLMVLGYALFLAAEFTMLYAVQQCRGAKSNPPLVDAPPARPLQLVRAWWSEVLTAPRVFYWHQPFRSHAEPDHLPDDAAGRIGIVLVHGLVCNRGFWNPWMRELRRRHVPFIAVSLEPVFGSIDEYAPIIESAVARMEARTNRPVVVVGHSMGGIAIRAWMRQHQPDGRVRRVITIASPHRGTWLARFAHTINGRQMRRGSGFLAELPGPSLDKPGAGFTCLYGHCDNIVFPAEWATLPGAENVHVPGVAHVQMAFQQVVFETVCRWTNPTGPADVPRANER